MAPYLQLVVHLFNVGACLSLHELSFISRGQSEVLDKLVIDVRKRTSNVSHIRLSGER